MDFFMCLGFITFLALYTKHLNILLMYEIFTDALLCIQTLETLNIFKKFSATCSCLHGHHQVLNSSGAEAAVFIWSHFLCGPMYVLVYPSVRGQCLCVLPK
jgi:hypothetical protein